MAVTKILARNTGLSQAIQYALNGDKTEHRILTAHQNCDPGWEYRQMMDTKREVGKLDSRQCYHIIQSFKPGEITPELALEIAKEFAAEYLPDYEVVIGTHVDRGHIHSHIVFNSVNGQTGEKYHVTTWEYYRQIRAISDRLCREHGLSVIMEGGPSQALSYIEWLRQSKCQPTFRSMLDADLRTAIQDANDLGHFFLLMEHMGWEISHGNRLGFRLRGQERFMIPGRKNPLFTEEGVMAAIQGNLAAIEIGQRPATVYHTPYRPFKQHPKYTGFMALYVHYLYVLGKIEKHQYPPKMTPQMKKEVMRFERCREQFSFLRENNISTRADMTAFQSHTEDALANLTKQRTLLNVRKRSGKSCTMPWPTWTPWPRPSESMRTGCPGWRRSTPGIWRRWRCWIGAPLPEAGFWRKRPACMSSWPRSTGRSERQESSWDCAGKSKVSSLRWSGR